MPKPPFSVSVFFEGEELQIGEHGYLGKIKAGRMRMIAECPEDADIHAFIMQGKKCIAPIRTRRSAGNKYFRADVSLEIKDPGFRLPGIGRVNSVEPVHPNSMHLVEFRSGGEFGVWEVSVLSWKGHFYAKTQLLHTATLYLDFQKNRVRCPYFEDEKGRAWPQLVEFCQRLMDEHRALLRLPDFVDYRPFSELKPTRSDEAVVIFFSFPRMFGVVRLVNGNL